MDVRVLREGLGVSQRELSVATGISQATLSRIESGVRVASGGELALIEIALGDREVPVPEVRAESQPVRRHVARPGVRRAFVCAHKDCVPPRRVFLGRGESGPAVCPEHGVMVRQPNVPYRGESTE
jgi:transcriptional regulator with XRE-family HTH domain